MQYPDNFETPAFPAGARIATSRAASIAVSVVLLLILFACGMLVWSVRSARISPILVATNENPNEWRIVGRDGGRRKIPSMIVLQQSLITNFIRRRFFISANAAVNESLWTACDSQTDCTSIGNTTTGTDCSLFCSATPALFADFTNNLVPDYRRRADMGQRWSVVPSSIRIMPMGRISENGGTWRVKFSIQSNVEAPLEMVAYVKVARNMRVNPRSMGYHIASFNAYRMN